MGFDKTYPVNLALPFTIGWAVIGTAFYIYLRLRRPEALDNLSTEMSRVQLVGEGEAAADRATRRVGVQ